ncbi:hypothetical protein KKD19_04535 [Patescibacteria group bacterium]|nr:hypothetical protein [Patescibacteria group bacterium]MBU4512475.1 hypothetical protein [Patescibacteria group bacterium]MCG2692603.1 hypothetical protein [Candidatus Parcubacteria bacterium]
MPHPLKKLISQKPGFSLIEIIIYLGIFVIATFIIMAFVNQSYQTLRFGDEQNTAIKNAQKGIETMVREIREARTGDNGAYALVQADDQQFIFYSDVDEDDATERVRYFLDGNDFNKGLIEPIGGPVTYPESDEVVTTISEYVQNDTSPIFYYYNADWPSDLDNNPLPTPSRLVETKLMRVYLKINVNPLRMPTHFELESYSQIRNLKTNL